MPITVQVMKNSLGLTVQAAIRVQNAPSDREWAWSNQDAYTCLPQVFLITEQGVYERRHLFGSVIQQQMVPEDHTIHFKPYFGCS